MIFKNVEVNVNIFPRIIHKSIGFEIVFLSPIRNQTLSNSYLIS